MRAPTATRAFVFGAMALAALAAPPPPGKTDKGPSSAAVPPKAGIRTPGVQIPIELLKAEVEMDVAAPGWITTGESVIVPDSAKNRLVRIDAKTNKQLDEIPSIAKPCSGTVFAFDSLWIPSCGSQSLTRFDYKAKKITATIATGAADVTIGIATSPDSIWMLTDAKSTLSRIDPEQNKVVGEMRLPAGCNSVAFGEGSLWVACPAEMRILRIDPATNLVDKRIEVSAGARSIAFGDSSVWVLCGKEGKIERIDPKTNKVVKTIELGVPGAGGNIAFADGWLWVTQTGFPLTRIDPKSEKERVVQQFWGVGGGYLTVTTGAVWLSDVGPGKVKRFDPKRVIATLAE